MDKVNKYNRYLFAIIGTVAVLGALLVLAFGAYELFRNVRFSRNVQVQHQAIEEAEEKLAENLERLSVTFREFNLLDSASNTYIIPVAQTISTEETDPSRIRNNGMSYSKKHYPRYFGQYNNLFIYRANQDLLHKIFKTRISISRMEVEEIGTQKTVFIYGAKKDTNRDGKLNAGDLQNLYVYHLLGDQLLEIETPNLTFLSHRLIARADYVVVQYGIDENKNGFFDDINEPMIFQKLNIKTGELETLIPKTIYQELQNTLEGK